MSALVGLYGGTFNPIHLGHLRAAEEVIEQLELERMIFIPSARPPHKTEADDDPIAPARERLHWAELATADNPLFEVDPIEVLRPGPSFLVETLRTLAERFAPEKPVFVLGRDAFCDLGSWREPQALLTLVNLAVTTRPAGSERAGAGRAAPPSLEHWLPDVLRGDVELAADGRSGRHRRAGTWLRLLEITDLDVSASDIRRRLRAGLSARYLLPDAVHQAVAASACFALHPQGELDQLDLLDQLDERGARKGLGER
jgi:nicotinate-nucleotide adenylyltransferase